MSRIIYTCHDQAALGLLITLVTEIPIITNRVLPDVYLTIICVCIRFRKTKSSVT
jgi:hypothetical protein